MRRKAFGAVCATILTLLAAAVIDARARARARERDDLLHRASARAVGHELALRAPSRVARHPTRAEPGAAMSEGPSVPDADPSGAGSAAP